MRYSIVVIILICLTCSFPLSAQGSQERYAYIVADTNGNYIIRIVDPQNPMQATQWLTLPISSGERIQEAFPSPNNEWLLVFLSSDNNASNLYLFNFYTGNMLPVATGISLLDRPDYLYAPVQNFSWSPNSRYFAINYADSNGLASIFLYDVVQNEATHLNGLNTYYYRIAWSVNSANLATVKSVCDTSNCTKTVVEIMDVESKVVTQSIDYTTSPAGNQIFEFCQLHWINNLYLSFVNTCDVTGISIPKGAMILDVVNQTTMQITAPPPSNIAPDNLVHTAYFDNAVIYNNLLLIGSEISSGDSSIRLGNSVETQTFVYSTASSILQQISNRRLGGWAITQSNLIGYVAFGYPESRPFGTFPQSIGVEIGQFFGQTISPIVSGPGGCNLSWNTAETILAYVETDISTLYLCSEHDTTIYFLNANDGSLKSHTPGIPILTIGWVNLPEGCDYTANSVSTLIANITQANTASTPQTICLNTNATYPFSQSSTWFFGDTALPPITGNITIKGNGATLERAATAPDFRLFGVDGTGTLTLENLTLNGGSLNENAGGAIVNVGGTVNLNNVTLENHQALNTSEGSGGAIYNYFGTLTMTNSQLLNNTAAVGAGGIYNWGGSVTVSNTCIVGNFAPDGLAVTQFDTATTTAADNWWGAADGPAGAGSGSGDGVGASIGYTPFLTSEAALNC
jgi:hypothetical protein